MSRERVASECTHRGERVSRRICMWRREPRGRSSSSFRRRGIDGREIKRGVIKAFASAAAVAAAAAPVRLWRVSAALDKKAVPSTAARKTPADSFLSGTIVSKNPSTASVSDLIGRGNGKRATLTLMSGAQSEVNYIDWWSDIKSIPFGSSLVMAGNVPSELPYL